MVLWQKVATKAIGNYVFCSLNISGVRKCKYLGTYKHQLSLDVDILTGVGFLFRLFIYIYIYLTIEIKTFLN